MFASSSSYRERCYGPPQRDWLDSPSYHRQAAAVGLVAAAAIENLGEAAIPALLSRLQHSPPGGDGCDERSALAALLRRMGPAGRKADLRRLHPHEVPASDEDAEWLTSLRRKGEGWSDELLWDLGRDKAALGRLGAAIDADIRARRDWREGEPAYFLPEADLLRRVLTIAPTDGGVSDERLREWATQGQSVGARWGAYLALGRRGDEKAQESVRESIEKRFLLRPDELRWWVLWGLPGYRFPDESAFLFVHEVAKSGLKDPWPLLLDLLSDPDPQLLAPRAAVLAALADHWQGLDKETKTEARRHVVEIHWTEKNEWLQGMTLALLAGHPVAEEDLMPAPYVSQ